MGWNTGWAIMQYQVITLYDLLGENFTADVCKGILKPYIETDMDEGGKDYEMESTDGKDEIEIVVDILFPNFDPENHKSEYEWDDMSKQEVIETAYSDKFYKLLRDNKYWGTNN